MAHGRLWRVLGAAVLILVSLVAVGKASHVVHSAPVQPPTPRLHTSIDALPLSFEVNRGQSDGRVKFLARSGGSTLFLTANDAVLSIVCHPRQTSSVPAPLSRSGRSNQKIRETSLYLHYVGANLHPHIIGVDRLPGKVNYFSGNDPRKWCERRFASGSPALLVKRG